LFAVEQNYADLYCQWILCAIARPRASSSIRGRKAALAIRISASVRLDRSVMWGCGQTRFRANHGAGREQAQRAQSRNRISGETEGGYAGWSRAG
jgi:hypothetical protein